MNEQALPAALDALDELIDRQAQVLESGDADALPAVAERLQQRLGQVARSVGRQPLQGDLRVRVAELAQRLRASQAMLVRRQLALDNCLKALATSSPGLQELQARRVYGAGSAFGASGCRSGGFERV